MAIARAFNLNKWIEDNRHLLKPPVGNKVIYTESESFVVMIVGGPNSRKDFHYNESEELFYQLQGDIIVKVVEDGKVQDIHIKEGDIFLLPSKTPHSPQRGANTVGLVVEKMREDVEIDSCMWFCENCSNKLYEEEFKLTDIVTQLPIIMNNFYNDIDKRTCKKCGVVMEPPMPIK